MMPTQTYIDNSGGKVVNIIPKRTMRHAHNPKALKTEEKKMSNPLKSHQNTLVSHPAPKLPSASNFRRFKINELTLFILTAFVKTSSANFSSQNLPKLQVS